MTFWKWSKIAANNATADATCPFPEGMAPSAVNDGTRGMMAAAAKYRDDIAGAIVTAGAVNAYTVSSYQGFDTLAHLDGQAIGFSPHITSTGAVLINIDGLGQKPLRPSPGVDFIGGELIQGTPYVAVYNNAAGEAYVRGYVSSPFNIPFLGGVDYWDTVAPNSAFIFPAGQAISRTVYAKAFARWSTFFGVGDGSTTFNVPDKRGRVSAASDNMGGSAANRLTGASGMGVGGFTQVGGAETHLLTIGEIPSHTHANTLTDPGHSHDVANSRQAAVVATGSVVAPQLNNGYVPGDVPTTTKTTGITISNAAQGGGAAHAIMQPTIVCNYIIRII